ncbi:hypothetical protein BIFBRE_04566 [Bifidobacterium breve DSM 20213 = JCM 1192]|uniref:Uncharacterized protein n=1 Tax=Bifidobacterium breve DSM 20213 = JCM 1192 TaxID=518634 RepID=D4BR33_BIFBR|nr:hypothetical protein BIFBRE_04566 [Bifidobacterium breve DSM 20213 = JCM 1192]
MDYPISRLHDAMGFWRAGISDSVIRRRRGRWRRCRHCRRR